MAVLAKKEPRTDLTFWGWGTLSSIINVGLKKSEIYYKIWNLVSQMKDFDDRGRCCQLVKRMFWKVFSSPKPVNVISNALIIWQEIRFKPTVKYQNANVSCFIDQVPPTQEGTICLISILKLFQKKILLFRIWQYFATSTQKCNFLSSCKIFSKQDYLIVAKKCHIVKSNF